MGVEPVVLGVRRWLWAGVAGSGLFLIGLVLWSVLAGQPLRAILIPAPVFGVVALVSGALVVVLAWDFLTADFILQITDQGITGWSQPSGFRSYRGERFEFGWGAIQRVDEARRWGTQQVRITADAGDHVYINPIHISGFSASDAGVIVALLEKQLAANR